MTSTVPLVCTWTPDKRDTRETLLAWWKYAKPRGRVRERRNARIGVVLVAAVGIGVAADHFPVFGVAVVTALLWVFCFLSVDRLAVSLPVRRMHRLPNAGSEI